MISLTRTDGDLAETLEVEPDGYGGIALYSHLELDGEPGSRDGLYMTAEMWAAFVAAVKVLPEPVGVIPGQLALWNLEGMTKQ